MKVLRYKISAALIYLQNRVNTQEPEIVIFFSAVFAFVLKEGTLVEITTKSTKVDHRPFYRSSLYQYSVIYQS